MSSVTDFRIGYDPGLAEEAVLRAIGGRPPAERTWFHRERAALYTVADADHREQAFARLYAIWLRRLGLDETPERTLAERPLISLHADGCLLARARARKEEEADVFVRDGRRTVAVRLRAELLIDAGRLLPFLRRQLLLVSDLLDPAFGYDRTAPASTAGPVYDAALRHRYRVVWEATVEGRLCREGLLPPGARDERRAEFLRAIPLPAGEGEAAFARWFDESRPTHQAIIEFVSGPLGFELTAAADGRCPICRFPTARRDLVVPRLPAAARHAVQAARPAWQPELGACRQCAALYEARYGGAA